MQKKVSEKMTKKFAEQCETFAKYCKANMQELLNLFVSVETCKMAYDEIGRGIRVLLEINKQGQYFTKKDLNACSVYLPKNQPFYSTILFAVVPSYFCKTVHVRPPVVLSEVFLRLEEIIKPFFPNIIFNYISRREYLKECTQKSNVVIYTGKSENAAEILKEISPNTLFIYNGGGCNPIVVTESCEINDDVIAKIVDAQLYNSGQDCMAPSAIFVNTKKYDKFIVALVEKVKRQKVGPNKDSDTDVGPLLDRIEPKKILDLADGATNIYGIQYDIEKNIVFPAVLAYNDLGKLPQQELYLPVFCVFRYENDKQITEYLSTKWAIESSTYISVFGNGETDFERGKYIIIENDVLDALDNGYTEFGGYGINSSYYCINGEKHAQPILISREISKYAK